MLLPVTIGICAVLLIVALSVRVAKSAPKKNSAKPKKRSRSKRKRVLGHAWPIDIPDHMAGLKTAMAAGPRVPPSSGSIEKLLASNPQGEVIISVLRVSPYGLRWLDPRTQDRKVRVLVGDIESGSEDWAMVDRNAAAKFIRREDVSVHMWTPPKRILPVGRSRKASNRFSERIWTVVLPQPDTDPDAAKEPEESQTPENDSVEEGKKPRKAKKESKKAAKAAKKKDKSAAKGKKRKGKDKAPEDRDVMAMESITGTADLTREGLRQDPTTMTDFASPDMGKFEALWESSVPADQFIYDKLHLVFYDPEPDVHDDSSDATLSGDGSEEPA